MSNKTESGPFGHYEKGGVGHVLNNLYHFGIPLSTVERVTVDQDSVRDGVQVFARYKYFDGIDQPLFHINSSAFDNRTDHNGNYVLVLGPHSNPAVILTGEHHATSLARETVKRCLTNYMDDKFYHLHQSAGAFFQGGSREDDGEYIYVEFWKPTGAQAWLDAFNEELKSRRAEEGKQ